MGCDIHAHIEVKINGKWEHYHAPSIPRWYRAFEKICGVRGDVKNAFAPPRGLPNDLSVVTQVCYKEEECDSHSPTWLNKDEFNGLIDWWEKEAGEEGYKVYDFFGYLTGNTYHLYPGSNPPEITDVRFICWFDN